jgi:hypothetical protein
LTALVLMALAVTLTIVDRVADLPIPTASNQPKPLATAAKPARRSRQQSRPRRLIPPPRLAIVDSCAGGKAGTPPSSDVHSLPAARTPQAVPRPRPQGWRMSSRQADKAQLRSTGSDFGGAVRRRCCRRRRRWPRSTRGGRRRTPPSAGP